MTEHTAVFLERLETNYPALPTKLVVHLGTLYGFSQVTNSEIRTAFYLVALKEPAPPLAAEILVQEVLDWVIGKDTGIIQGRMKFCRPLFRAADKVDRAKTIAAYCSARTLFHPIARKLIEEEVRRSCLSTLGDVADDGFAGSVERLLNCDTKCCWLDMLCICSYDPSVSVKCKRISISEIDLIGSATDRLSGICSLPGAGARPSPALPGAKVSQNNHTRA